MNDTQISRSDKIIDAGLIITDIRGVFTDSSLSRAKSRWPATIFAVSRTAKVIGRINWLLVSIKTSKGIKKAGVPSGKRWAAIWIMLFAHPLIRNLSQIVIANSKFSDTWAVAEKLKGAKDIMFSIITVRKIEIKVRNVGHFMFFIIGVISIYIKFTIDFLINVVFLDFMVRSNKNGIGINIINQFKFK